MPCITEYVAYCGSCVALAGAVAAVAAELGSGAGAPLTIPTAAAAVAAAVAVIASGMAWANCIEAAGKADEAAQMRAKMERLQREVDEMNRRLQSVTN